jgi:hypothetical protein
MVVAAENENEMLKRKLKTMSGQLETLTNALHRAQADMTDAQNKQVWRYVHIFVRAYMCTCLPVYICSSSLVICTEICAACTCMQLHMWSS